LSAFLAKSVLKISKEAEKFDYLYGHDIKLKSEKPKECSLNEYSSLKGEPKVEFFSLDLFQIL
jgi:hypothetical protein